MKEKVIKLHKASWASNDVSYSHQRCNEDLCNTTSLTMDNTLRWHECARFCLCQILWRADKHTCPLYYVWHESEGRWSTLIKCSLRPCSRRYRGERRKLFIFIYLFSFFLPHLFLWGSFLKAKTTIQLTSNNWQAEPSTSAVDGHN